MRLIDCSNDELANALHEMEGNEDEMERSELIIWRRIKELVLYRVEIRREIDENN